MIGDTIQRYVTLYFAALYFEVDLVSAEIADSPALLDQRGSCRARRTERGTCRDVGAT